jgi:YD repeat-containing protein
MTTSQPGETGRKETITYDPGYRPLHYKGKDLQIDWSYGAKEAMTVTITPAKGEPWKMTRSADGSEETWQMQEGGNYTIKQATGGPMVAPNSVRATEILQNGRPVLRQEWRRDGQTSLIQYENVAFDFRYGDTGVPTLVYVALPSDPKSYKVKVEFDAQGRPSQITEPNGGSMRLDDKGEIAEWSPDGKNKLAVERDSKGRPQAVKTSWGYEEKRSYDGEQPRQTVIGTVVDGTRHEAVVEYDRGRPTRLKQFDGGEVQIAYGDREGSQDQPSEIRLPSGLVLKYEYDEAKRLTAVTCGDRYRLLYSYDAKGRLQGVKHVPCGK